METSKRKKMKRSWSFEDDVTDEEMIKIGEMYDLIHADRFVDDDDFVDGDLVSQDGGGDNNPLFEFEQEMIGRPQRFQNTLVKQRFRTKKRQLRDAQTTENLGAEITGAVAHVANEILAETGRRWRQGVQNEDRVLFNFSTPRFHLTWTSRS